MNEQANRRAIDALNAINNYPPDHKRTWKDGDPEDFHGQADEILLALVDPNVRRAYEALIERCSWWAFA
jgi:hypothetical protein